MQKNIASKNVSRGNAGFYPSVNLITSNNYSVTQLHQKISNPTLGESEINRDGVQQSNINSGAGINWVVFNGFRRNYAYSRLKHTLEQADARANLNAQNLIADVTKAYYEILRQQEISSTYQNNLGLYNERLRLAENLLANGMVSKNDVLVSKVDINTQKSILIDVETDLENARIELNHILKRDPSYVFTLADDSLNPLMRPDEVYNQKSPSIQVTQEDIAITERIYKENNSNYFPVLSVNANYNFFQSSSTAGQVRLNQTLGPNAGFTFSWNIFDGFNKSRIRQTGLLNIDISKALHKENVNTVSSEYRRAVVSYNNALKKLQLEAESFKLAKESNSIARERYTAGQLNLVGYKDAQLMLENTSLRLANARYNALTMEAELNKLSGN